MVGVGVIGTGFGRVVHIPGFLAVRNATVVGVASRKYERARQVAREFSLPKSFPTWKELIECSDIEAVSIATPPQLHEEVALTALTAGKAVLCEKPLALDTTQARTMLKAARKSGVVHMVDFEFREIPAWRFAKQLLESGDFGSFRHVNVNWIVQSWSDPTRPWSWRADRAQGGGALAALGVHVFDYIEWLLGPLKSMAAQLSTRITKRPSEFGMLRTVSSEDYCNLMLELRDGTPVNLMISQVARFGKGLWMEFYGERKVLVVGSDNRSDYGKGFRIWIGESGSNRLRELRLPKRMQFKIEFADGRVAPFVRLAQRFVDAIKTEKRVVVHPSFEDGYRAQVLLDLALQAHKERRWVTVPPLQIVW